MRNLVLSMMIVLAAAFSLSSCGESTPAVELSAEMTEFVGMIKGTSDDATKALEKFAANDDIKDNDLGMFELKDPKVTAKTGDCYTVDFSEGATTRTYEICWADGKINKITDKGME